MTSVLIKCSNGAVVNRKQLLDNLFFLISRIIKSKVHVISSAFRFGWEELNNTPCCKSNLKPFVFVWRYKQVNFKCWIERSVTKTTVEFHPHGDVGAPSCGCQSDVSCFDWWSYRMFNHRFSITVSNEHLQEHELKNVYTCFLGNSYLFKRAC